MHFYDCGSHTEKSTAITICILCFMTSYEQTVYESYVGVNFSISSLPNNGMERCDIRPPCMKNKGGKKEA